MCFRSCRPIRPTRVVNPPFLSLSEPRQFLIPVGRRLTTRDGSFDGVVAITFTPAALRAFFRTIDVGRGGAVWVLHPDGSVLVREPSDANPIGEKSLNNPIFKAAQASAAGIVEGPVAANGRFISPASALSKRKPTIAHC